MGAFTATPPAAAPAKTARTAAASRPAKGKAQAVDPYREAVVRARSEEAETRAEAAAALAALRAEQAQGMRAATGEARIERHRLNGDLTADLAARQGELRRDQGTSRADAAARGISSGATARALLQGLADEADGDMAAARSDAARRVNDLRRGLEVKQRENLLALAALRQRNRLAVREARNDTIFAARNAWLRQVTDRREILDRYREDMAEYRRDLADYNRRIADQNRAIADQRDAERGAERGRIIDDASEALGDGLTDFLFRRR